MAQLPHAVRSPVALLPFPGSFVLANKNVKPTLYFLWIGPASNPSVIVSASPNFFLQYSIVLLG